MRKNIIIDTDYYKTTHRSMYPANMNGLYSYAEARGGEYETAILFGLQAYIKDNLLTPITKEDVDYADAVISPMGTGFDRTPWDTIVSRHGGFLPLRITAVPEGLKVSVSNALVTVENTDPELAFLTSYIETALIRLWYPTTIASKSYEMRRKINKLYKKYADTGASADFALLDFGSRGVPTFDTNALGGAAFLTSFSGTDSIPAVSMAREYYGGEVNGFSVKATEHSVMTSWTQDREQESLEHLIRNVAGKGDTISIVCDSWNIYKAVEILKKMAVEIEAKELTLVIRPDSGNPAEVMEKLIKQLDDSFFTRKRNDKELKVFTNVKLLWGDGVNEGNYKEILKTAPLNGYGVENLLLGSGGGLLQNVNRDTMKFAFKASAVHCGNGPWTPIFKDPIDDQGKRSKRGRVTLIKEHSSGKYRTVDTSIARQLGIPQMQTVYENGKLLRDQSMKEIRDLIWSE